MTYLNRRIATHSMAFLTLTSIGCENPFAETDGRAEFQVLEQRCGESGRSLQR